MCRADSVQFGKWSLIGRESSPLDRNHRFYAGTIPVCSAKIIAAKHRTVQKVYTACVHKRHPCKLLLTKGLFLKCDVAIL